MNMMMENTMFMNKIIEYITDMNNTTDDIMNLMIEHISYMNIF